MPKLLQDGEYEGSARVLGESEGDSSVVVIVLGRIRLGYWDCDSQYLRTMIPGTDSEDLDRAHPDEAGYRRQIYPVRPKL